GDYVWTLSRPEAVYARLAEGESAFNDAYGFGGRFPHRVGREPGKSLFTALRASPPSTTIVLRAAEAGIAGMQLGQRGETDLLLLSLSGLDYVGHAHGTSSRERLDMLLRMHDGLSEFVPRRRLRDVDPGRAEPIAAPAFSKLPGMWRAVTPADMPAQDILLRHSFHPARSGDVMFVQAPLVTVAGADVASHGSPWTEDSLV